MEEVTPFPVVKEGTEPIPGVTPVEILVAPGPGFPGYTVIVDEFKTIVREYIMQFSYDKFVDRMYQSGLDETFKEKLLLDMKYGLGLAFLQTESVSEIHKVILTSLYAQKDKLGEVERKEIVDKIAILNTRADLNIDMVEVKQ
jgi:hypothetical protein